MNNSFSLKRTWQLICGQWSENRKFYLYGMLALLGLVIFTSIIWISNSDLEFRKDSLIDTYFVGLLLIGAIFANNSFRMLNSKAESIQWFSIPASPAEKLICILFYNVIVFTIVYALCCFLVSYFTFSYVDRIVRQNYKYSSYSIKANWNKDSELRKIATSLSYAFFVVQGLFILGSVYFKKYSFILTTIIIVILFFAATLYFQKLSHYFAPNATFEINELRIYGSSLRYSALYKIYNPFANIIVFILKIIGGPFLWLVTWYRLKEKEI